MLDLNNLTPWINQKFGLEQRSLRKKIENTVFSHKKTGYVNKISSNINFSPNIKKPITIQFESQVQEPGIKYKIRALSLQPYHKKRKKQYYGDTLPLIQSQYPIEPETMIQSSPVYQDWCNIKTSNPQYSFINSLVNQQRKYTQIHANKIHSKIKSDIKFPVDKHSTSEDHRLKSYQEIQHSSRKSTRQLQKIASNNLIRIKTKQGFEKVNISKLIQNNQRKSSNKVYSNHRFGNYLDIISKKN